MTELITRSKQRKIIATAKAFLAAQESSAVSCRFDVALVSDSSTIEYIENAFTESG
jgi:Holliday junction resolvase-like predicted endonuclease